MKLFIAGDSTAAEKQEDKRPESGWGEYLQPLCAQGVQVRNFAQNGRSTKSFIADGLLDRIAAEIREGDWLLIQFGHNDGKKEDLARYTQPDGEYGENLLRYIEVARKAGSTPICVTSVTRREFVEGVLAGDTVGPYPEAMRRLAGRHNVPVVDMYTASWELVRALGDEDSSRLYLHLPAGENDNYPDGIQDDTHFNEYGARRMAELFVNIVCQQMPAACEGVFVEI